MILNLNALSIEELEEMLHSQSRLLEESTASFRSQVTISEQDAKEYRIKRHAFSESILAIKRALARKRSTEWVDEEAKVRSKAQQLIARVHSGAKSDGEWLALEEEIHLFFKGLPHEMWIIADEMFISDGAGELIYMICSGIRYTQTEVKQHD